PRPLDRRDAAARRRGGGDWPARPAPRRRDPRFGRHLRRAACGLDGRRGGTRPAHGPRRKRPGGAAVPGLLQLRHVRKLRGPRRCLRGRRATAGGWVMTRCIALLWLVLGALGTLGCQSEPQSSAPQKQPASSATPSGDTTPTPRAETPASTPEDAVDSVNGVDGPGLHRTARGTALAFAPGMTLEETRAIVREAVAAKQLDVGETQQSTRPLGGVDVDVLV